MKFRITMKDPDGVHESIVDAAKLTPAEVAAIPEFVDVVAAEAHRREALTRAAHPWVEHGEYITIEIDTDARTAVVVERAK